MESGGYFGCPVVVLVAHFLLLSRSTFAAAVSPVGSAYPGLRWSSMYWRRLASWWWPHLPCVVQPHGDLQRKQHLSSLIGGLSGTTTAAPREWDAAVNGWGWLEGGLVARVAPSAARVA